MEFYTKRKKEFIMISFLLIIIINSSPMQAYANSKTDSFNKEIHYFYLPTCYSCKDINEYVDTLKANHPEVGIYKHNIVNSEDKLLLDHYIDKYSVPMEKDGYVPIIFIGNKYLFGRNSIIQESEKLLVSIIYCWSDYGSKSLFSCDVIIILLTINS